MHLATETRIEFIILAVLMFGTCFLVPAAILVAPYVRQTRAEFARRRAAICEADFRAACINPSAYDLPALRQRAYNARKRYFDLRA